MVLKYKSFSPLSCGILRINTYEIVLSAVELH